MLAYLGINASRVNSDRSMFDHRYLGMYLVVAAVIVLGVLRSAGIYIQQRRAATHRPPREEHPRWALAPDTPDS